VKLLKILQVSRQEPLVESREELCSKSSPTFGTYCGHRKLYSADLMGLVFARYERQSARNIIGRPQPKLKNPAPDFAKTKNCAIFKCEEKKILCKKFLPCP
jgi:hypothetical protein